MKVEDGIVLVVTLNGDEQTMAQEIADRDGITLEEAVQKAVENFLSSGVQTPDSALKSA